MPPAMGHIAVPTQGIQCLWLWCGISGGLSLSKDHVHEDLWTLNSAEQMECLHGPDVAPGCMFDTPGLAGLCEVLKHSIFSSTPKQSTDTLMTLQSGFPLCGRKQELPASCPTSSSLVLPMSVYELCIKCLETKIPDTKGKQHSNSPS